MNINAETASISEVFPTQFIICWYWLISV